MTKQNLKNALAGHECHYAGHSKRPARIFSSDYFGTIYCMMKESEAKYGEGCNDEKYNSFIFNGKGIGIHKQNGYIFLGIRLFGVQTLVMVGEGTGYGKEGCLVYDHYEGNILGFEFYYEQLKARGVETDLEEEFNNWKNEYLVGNLIPMKELEEGDLDDFEKENIRKIFERVIEKSSTAISRNFNPDKVAEDQPNLDKVRKLLA